MLRPMRAAAPDAAASRVAAAVALVATRPAGTAAIAVGLHTRGDPRDERGPTRAVGPLAA